MKQLLLAATLLLAVTAHAQTKASQLFSQTSSTTSTTSAVDNKAKAAWLATAGVLYDKSNALQNNTLSSTDASKYKLLAQTLSIALTDDPATIPASTVHAQLAKWIKGVEAGQYDNRFSK